MNKIYVLTDSNNVIIAHGIPLNDTHIPLENGIAVEIDLDLEKVTLEKSYKLVDGQVVKLTDDEKIDLDEIKQIKIQELNQAMSDYIINNFYSSCLGTSKKFDCEQTDQIYIQGLAMKSQMILAGQQLSDTTTNWKESGVDICYHFEPIQCIQLGVDLSIHLTQSKEKKEKLVVYVKSLNDKDTINSVNWDTVIPAV